MLIVSAFAALCAMLVYAGVVQKRTDHEQGTPAAEQSSLLPPVRLVLGEVPKGPVTESSFALSGRVTPGAALTVEDRTRPVTSRFRIPVTLRAGLNRIRLSATKPGFRKVTRSLLIRREPAAGPTTVTPPVQPPTTSPTTPSPP